LLTAWHAAYDLIPVTGRWPLMATDWGGGSLVMQDNPTPGPSEARLAALDQATPTTDPWPTFIPEDRLIVDNIEAARPWDPQSGRRSGPSWRAAVGGIGDRIAVSLRLSDTAGRLTAEMSFDAIVLDWNALAIEPEQIQPVRVDQTWFAGRLAHGVGQ
jgi:hypothetical protein